MDVYLQRDERFDECEHAKDSRLTTWYGLSLEDEQVTYPLPQGVSTKERSKNA
jgi:hypothetical protein